MVKRRVKAKRAAKPAKPAERPIAVKIDPALAAAWKKSLAVLSSSEIHEAEAWDLKYETIGRILGHEPPLYLAGGLSTAADFFRAYLPGEDPRSILRSVRVAQYASPEEETTYTASKIDAALDYLEAKHGKPASGRLPVSFPKLRVETKDGPVAFAEATVHQIHDATRTAKRSHAKGGAAKGASPVVAAVAKLLPADAKEVTVHYADGRLTLGRIPVRLFVEVMRALAKARVPLMT